MAKKTKKQTILEQEIAQKCIAIVDQERVNWEDAVSFITPKVAFRMRELIRTLRKNYWGVFDTPIDKNTNREKIWMGLAMSTVETWVKNIDIDQKDIGFIARNPNGNEMTHITRLVVKEYLDRMYFGEILDADERQVLIDGTVVWKTWEGHEAGKPVLKRRTVDLLNFYIDPTEENIQSAYRVTERCILLPSQIEAMSGWMNTETPDGDELPGSHILNRADGSRQSNFGTRTTGSFRDVWECWGKIPQWLVTGDKKADDAMDEIDGHIVVSGFEAGGPVLHLVERNTTKDIFGNIIKPYEEWRAAKISGRWYGLGPVERILSLQEYLNTIINIRINKHYISQLGLFSIKKGKGITAQMLARLSANGALPVTDHTDIQPLEVPQDDGTSYKDEQIIRDWAQQISSAFPISNGEIPLASASATASNIASTSAKSSYTMFIEGTGSFLERWIDRGALPVIAKTVKAGDIVKISEEDDSFDDLIENIALNHIAETLDKSNVIPSKEELVNELVKEHKRLKANPALFIKTVQKIITDGIETKVHITNEDIDTNVAINHLMQLMNIPPENRDPMLLKQIYDLMGLQMPKQPLPQQVAPQAQGGQPAPAPQGGGQPSPQPVSMQGMMQGANIPK